MTTRDAASVPVLLKEVTPEKSLEIALVENIQRADLNPLEEAEAFQALISDFGLNQHQPVFDAPCNDNITRLAKAPKSGFTLDLSHAIWQGAEKDSSA